MRLSSLLVLFGSAFSGFALICSAQARSACTSASLPEAARTAISIRHGLHTVAVGELDPVVPPAVATQLGRLKDALTASAAAALSCSSANITPEALQAALATALHANLADAPETVTVTPSHKDLGAYGSDLEVQVLPLSNAPRHLEINFRYGIECGDDNLLLVFRQDPGGWQQILRWDAPHYARVSDAFGDFVLLTPLTGLPEHPNWRAVVAHGRPTCSAEDYRSRFDLDLLEPDSDPAHPTVAWHLDRPYGRTDTPRLGTTEDTLTFELIPPTPGKDKASGAISPAAQSYRYSIDSDNKVKPIDLAPGRTATSPITPSPRP